MWDLMSSLSDLSVSYSPAAFSGRDVCLGWTTPAEWSCRLQAADKREELLTSAEEHRQQDGAERRWGPELVPSSLLLWARHWLANTGCLGLQDTVRGRAYLYSGECFSEIESVMWVTICSMFVTQVRRYSSPDSFDNWERRDKTRLVGSEVTSQLWAARVKMLKITPVNLSQPRNIWLMVVSCLACLVIIMIWSASPL